MTLVFLHKQLKNIFQQQLNFIFSFKSLKCYPLVCLLLLIPVLIDAQTREQNILNNTRSNNSSPVFQRIEQSQSANKKVTADFYPLKTGDFWEYIEGDTVTIMGNKRSMRYSLAKEVMGDSVIGDYTYKKIIYEVCANSIQRADSCELQRIDSIGNVYYFFNGRDQLRYDFSRGIGERFPSPYSDRYWEVADRYTVVGFGDTLQAIDFCLYNNTGWYERIETVTEKFGLTYYKGSPYSYNERPAGNFFGGILNGITYGNLLVKKQKVDWNEFYPLHIGDFWKYEAHDGPIPSISTKLVLGDTLMPDNNKYKVIAKQSIGGPYPSKGISYERIDSLGNVDAWDIKSQLATRVMRLSNIVGDTVFVGASSFGWKIADKLDSTIYFVQYPYDFAYKDYTKGLGMIGYSNEGSGLSLVGAVINGIVYWDTTAVGIKQDEGLMPENFTLHQNYPNPFNPETTINYTLPESGIVQVKIFDVLGHELKTLVNEFSGSGRHSVKWDGSSYSSGVYFCSITFNGKMLNNKMLLMK
jgi:hypothetical protein